MKKILTIIFFLVIFFLKAELVYADPVAGSSAAIKKDPKIEIFENQPSQMRIYKIRKSIFNILKEYNSPLINEVNSFVDACLEYKLNCYLLPSIAGLESTFGKFIWPNSFNPFGWGGGYIMFKNWNEGIFTVAQGLRKNYIDKGAQDLSQIGKIYSESTTWTPRVQYFINKFNNEEEKIELFLSLNQVKL
ncbi:MAG: hypothetical protein QXG00_05455 [Candidatus Woesearchaeota archaeon]